jgi:hypothetical protein
VAVEHVDAEDLFIVAALSEGDGERRESESGE